MAQLFIGGLIKKRVIILQVPNQKVFNNPLIMDFTLDYINLLMIQLLFEMERKYLSLMLGFTSLRTSGA